MIFNSIEQELAYQDELFIREYDRSNFISNAKYAINGTVSKDSYTVTNDNYEHMLRTTIDRLNNIILNKNMLNVLHGWDQYQSNNVLTLTYISQDVGSIKASYLADYVEFIGNTIEKLLNGDDASNIKNRLITDLPFLVKQRIVKTTNKELLRQYYPKELISNKDTRLIYREPMSDKLVQKVIVPSIKNFDSVKNTVNNEVEQVMSQIKSCDATVNAYKTVISQKKQSGELRPEMIKQLDYIIYNALRQYIEIKSYMTFMLLRKINNIIFNAISCSELYDELVSRSTNVTVGKRTEYTESVIDGSVIPTDTEALSSSMLEGNSDGYQVIANNILQFHKGMMINSDSRYDDKDSVQIINDMSLDDMSYSKEPYENTQKIFILINECLTILAKNSDDYLMIFDDLIEKSGLSLGIVEKYKPVVDAATDLSMYSPVVDNQNHDSYMRMLKEVEDYPRNMDKLAKTVYEVFSTIHMLQERFKYNINGEFKNASAVTEINEFLTEFESQFKTLVNLVAGNFMIRLKGIAVKLESLRNNDSPVRSTSDVYGESFDFMDIAYESIMDDIMDTNDIIFESYSMQFFVEKEYLEKGVNVIFEADDQQTNDNKSSNTTNTTTNSNNSSDANKSESNDKVTATDNNSTNDASTNTSGQKNITKNALEKIKNKLNQWMDELKKAFQSFTAKFGKYHLNWLNGKINSSDENSQTRKDYLLNRSYNNCEANILPYEKNMPRENILKDVNSLRNHIKSLTAGEIANIGSIEAMAQKLLSFIPKDKLATFNTKAPANNNGNNNESDSVAVVINKFYKVGNNKYETVTYSNGELKTLIGTIIPSMESYYNTFVNEIVKAIEGVNEDMKSTFETYVTESTLLFADEIDFYTEADEPTNNQTTTTTTTTTNTSSTNDKKDSSLIVKTEWVRTICKTYTSSVLNSLRDRYNDYFALLKKFVPAGGNATNNTSNNTETDSGETSNESNDQK